MAKAGNGSGTHHVVPNPNGGWDVRRGGAERDQQAGAQLRQVFGQGLLVKLFLLFHRVHHSGLRCLGGKDRRDALFYPIRPGL